MSCNVAPSDQFVKPEGRDNPARRRGQSCWQCAGQAVRVERLSIAEWLQGRMTDRGCSDRCALSCQQVTYGPYTEEGDASTFTITIPFTYTSNLAPTEPFIKPSPWEFGREGVPCPEKPGPARRDGTASQCTPTPS